MANKQSDSQEPSSPVRTASTTSNSAKSNMWLYFAGWPELTLMSKWCFGNKF